MSYRHVHFALQRTIIGWSPAIEEKFYENCAALLAERTNATEVMGAEEFKKDYLRDASASFRFRDTTLSDIPQQAIDNISLEFFRNHAIIDPYLPEVLAQFGPNGKNSDRPDLNCSVQSNCDYPRMSELLGIAGLDEGRFRHRFVPDSAYSPLNKRDDVVAVFFEGLIGKIGLRPQEILFVDSSPYWLKEAKERGLATGLVTDKTSYGYETIDHPIKRPSDIYKLFNLKAPNKKQP